MEPDGWVVEAFRISWDDSFTWGPLSSHEAADELLKTLAANDDVLWACIEFRRGAKPAATMEVS